MKETILIIDDEVKIIEVIKLYLENEGYTVIQATSGIEALKKQSEFNPDLLILDLMLPDISGENVCERIREESEVPIIMLTAKSSEDSILNGYSIGSDDYITKPFKVSVLMSRINALLRRANDFCSAGTELHSNGIKVLLLQGQTYKNGKLSSLPKIR